MDTAEPLLDAGDTSGVTAWSISSWTRGSLLDCVEYKAALLGIEIETVNPWGTSRYCPRCGECGRTVTAPDEHTECRHGGHFHCPSCGYECDRDVIGELNIGRKYLSECKMETATPAAYTEAGKHASFLSRTHSALADNSRARSAGVNESSALVRKPERERSGEVESTTETGSVSGRQTRRSHQRAPLCDERSGIDTGGLTKITGRNTEYR